MARSRNIKPGFYANEDLAECSIWARYIFPGLWMMADREGRLEDRPKKIKGELLRFDGPDMEPLLAELASRKDAQGVPFIVRYRNSDGQFIQISKFKTHQSPHYSEKQSIIKPPTLRESSGDDGVNILGLKPEKSENSPAIKKGSQPPDSLIPDSLIPDSGKELARKPAKPAFQMTGFHEFWTHYPRKGKKPRAEEAWSLLAPDEDLRITILASLEQWKASRQWSDKNFIPLPENWLKNRQFDDDVPRETTPVAKQDLAAKQWLDEQGQQQPSASLKIVDRLPDDFVADFINDWAAKLGVTQGADESDDDHRTNVLAAIEVDAKTGNPEAVDWLERYGEQAKSMVAA